MTDTDPMTATDPDPVEIDLSDSQRFLRVDPARVREIAGEVFRCEGISGGSLSIAIVDNATIHGVNRRHLDHDWPTDVISFLLSDENLGDGERDGDGGPEFSGELVISAEMAASVAREGGLDPDSEFALYLIHGLLHLCGYDDRDEPRRDRMRRREDEILDALGIPRPPRDLPSGDDDPLDPPPQETST